GIGDHRVKIGDRQPLHDRSGALRHGGQRNRSQQKTGDESGFEENLHQNWVPTLKVKALVSSPSRLRRTLEKSMRNGPNGEFQFTPMPIARRGFQVSPTKTSRKR